MLDDTITLALRAMRHPQTGLAALLAGVAPALNARAGAVYLEPAAPGPAELLAVGGPDASAVGRPGPVEGPVDDMVRALALETALLAGPTPEGQPSPWGSFGHRASIATPLPAGGGCLLLIGAREPVDEPSLRRISAPVAVLAAALVAAREVELLQRDLHEVRQERTLLAAGLQHDLRTPLTSIIGCARTLQASGHQLSRDEREEMLAIIASQAERLNDMVGDALGREAQGPDAPLRLGPATMRDLATKVASAAETGRGGEVHVDVADASVVTDSGRLERALLNLLDNALKYSPAGGAAHLMGERTADGFTFTVADCGPGVSSAVVPRLFSAYATDPDRVDGVGLGLHSVATIAADLGGRVAFGRREGWTRFSLTIPDLRTGPMEPRARQRESIP